MKCQVAFNLVKPSTYISEMETNSRSDLQRLMKKTEKPLRRFLTGKPDSFFLAKRSGLNLRFKKGK